MESKTRIDNTRRSSTVTADIFFICSIGVLGINFINPAIAFPPQCLMALYALLKFDVKYLPSLLILLLDKGNFTSVLIEGDDAGVFKLLIAGLPVSVLNLFLAELCAVSIIMWIRKKLAPSMNLLMVLWLVSLVVSGIISIRAIGRVPYWLNPVAGAMAFSLYFYGYLLAPSWMYGYRFLLKRFVVTGSILMLLSFFGFFSGRLLFLFAACLPAFSLYLLLRNRDLTGRLVAFAGLFSAYVYVLFFRYVALERLDRVAESTSQEIGSSLTILGICVLATLFTAIYCLTPKVFRRMTNVIPWGSLLLCFLIVVYAAKRYQATEMDGSDIRSFQERAIFKLIGDRGQVWSDSMDEALKAPYIIKHQEDRLVLLSTNELGQKLLPHNQYLFLLVIHGWLSGNILALLLWITHLRSFRAVQDGGSQYGVGVVVITGAVLFICVGLTGQNHLISLGDSWGVLLFSGTAYGVFLKGRCTKNFGSL